MRKLATAAAVSLALASGGVKALGLGDIEMRSALNQPMNAEIRLTSVKPGEADGMIVKLASPDAFARAGIDRTNALTELQFSVDTDSSNPVIRITSRSPVVEPFLNFLLEVDWPSGRMVREYTVLLDPPVFMSPSASNRNTGADQPVLVQRSESLLAPAPIERNSNASVADSFEVEIVGSAEEISNNAVIASDTFSSDVVSLDGDVVSLEGDVVSLGDLETGESADFGTVVELEGSEVSLDSFADQGEVVVLSDLGETNTAAAGQFASDFEFEVEVVGDLTEVSDLYSIEGGDQVISIEGESEIVSLESLDSTVGSSAGGGEVVVQRGDTLGAIAANNAVAGVSAQQMMMALLNANQSAFINGNVNLVKAGAILRIPDASEVNQLSQAQALAQLSEQNQLWQEYRDGVRSSTGTRVAQASRSATSNDSDAAGTQADASDAPSADNVAQEAQRILDSALNEIQSRDELKIVADNDSTSKVASSTADSEQTDQDSQLSNLNRKIQLAKEELASTRLESADLADQSSELKSTSENQESLVSIRQQEVARLQEQLKAASEDADAAGNASDAASMLVANAQDAVSNGAADASDALAGVAGDASDAAGNAADSAQNALSNTGEQLSTVELLPDANVAPLATEITPPVKQTPWYTDLLQQYGKFLVIGIGAICALMAGWLLFFKRRRKEEDILDFEDDVEFVNDDSELFAEVDAPETSTPGAGTAVAAGAAGAAAVGGAAAAAFNKDDEVLNEEFATAGEETQAVEQSMSEDELDPDDTISEVDVYLAYGLHGQAEELLQKAIEREPNNPEYALKMLQTHHAQGNGDAFNEAAAEYHQRFGGDGAPDWNTVSEMGYDLQPNNALFSASADDVASVGKGSFDSPKLEDKDFLSADASDGAESISRDFGADSAASIDTSDESQLMDQSLDPAFAFDETDLEATGDFSQIANEIASEEPAELDLPSLDSSSAAPDLTSDDGSLDFPGFDADGPVDKIGDAAASAGAGAKGAAAGLAGGAAAAMGVVGAKASAAKDKASDALNFDDLEIGGSDKAANDVVDSTAGSVAEDLTLDLDQLSGDLELDSTDLMEDPTASVDSLEIPDLTSDNELLDGGGAAAVGGESSDEMDTMMDLAKAYIDMGDKDSASSALGEIVKSGNPAQVTEAETLLRKIS